MLHYGHQTAEQIIAAEQWFTAYEKMLRMIARDETDLQEYEQKPDHNTKAVAIRREKLQQLKTFASVARSVIELQAGLLAEKTNATGQLYRLQKEHELLKAYARSKGCDLTALPYLTKKDFNL